jgi:hypothetical protein
MFIPDVERAVAEMRRVVRLGGRVAATVWDTFGGVPWIRLLWDTAAVLDPTAERPRALFSSLTAPGEMSAMRRKVGLTEVEQTSLTIRIDYANFDEYWRPLESHDSPVGPYLAALSDQSRAALREHVRRGFLCNRPTGRARSRLRRGPAAGSCRPKRPSRLRAGVRLLYRCYTSSTRA